MICYMRALPICSLGDWQFQFGEDFFHILQDLSAIVIGIIPQQVNKNEIPFSPLVSPDFLFI